MGTGLAFIVMIATVLIQVVGRFYGTSPIWSEELTRFALLYLVAFGSGLSFLSGDLASVDILDKALPGKLQFRLRVISTLATGLLCLLLIMPAWKFTSIGRLQTSPAMGLRMDFVHASVLVLLCSMTIFAMLRVVELLRGKEDGLPSKSKRFH